MCEQRKQQLISAIEDAGKFISSSDELEVDYFDDVEINGEHKAGWFACRYDGHSSTRLLEEPLITDYNCFDNSILSPFHSSAE